MRTIAAVSTLLVGSSAADIWDSIREGVDTWAKLDYNTHFAVNVGDKTGRKFVYEIGNTTMNTRMQAASSSKWPSAAMISGVVNAGYMSYDDKPSKFLPWWTTDPTDTRSNITLKQMLSFTDGYQQDKFPACAANESVPLVECAKELYEITPHTAIPGTTWKYLECHYQFAGAMASAATNMSMHELYEKFLFKPFGMVNTTYGTPPYLNPQLAAGMTSTGNDYERYLQAILKNTVLPKSITDVMETDYTAPPVSPTGMFFGHYCMGNFFECYGYTIGMNISQPHVIPERCAVEKIHSDPGLWGWFPIMDRSREFYMQVAIKENYIKAGIPEYLTMMAKPVINNILKGVDPATVNRQDLLTAGGGMILRDLFGIDVASKVIPSEVETDNAIQTIWTPLHEGLGSWHRQGFSKRFAFNVGNASGTQFTSSHGEFFNMRTKVEGASLSKWPAAAMISGLVADGILNFDDLASKHLSWWTTNPSDHRSKITLRHLLTFQSGYQEDKEVACAKDPAGNFIDCVQQLYNALPAGTAPGTNFTYISAHLQFAGAMAVKASGIDIDQLFDKYLYKPAGMVDTTWGKAPYKNPQVATGITTTGSDFEGFLKGLLLYTLLPKAVCDEMEKDYSASVTPSGDGWFGHYGMGHWFECIGYGTPNGSSAPISQACQEEAIQAGPGLYGFYPLIDRKRGYYMQVVLQESMEKSGIPEYLRIITKPVVDAIMAGKDSRNVNRYDLLTNGGGLLLRDLVYIQKSRDGEL
eukprot:TRINITY_DN867_c0_g1_i1.p1 TRINITY_DN867_c0_g1~~TRINITY_DN867_c0_g1_i1.p1  ORF type:complete len:753 (+),score=175.72 TRINITY_DN867_c0_g1_i1:147-2405(+)